MSYLSVKGVSKTVGGSNILSNISLEFEKTGLVFIVGKSGAGKSTLLNIIGQLDNEYSGEVVLDNNVCKKDYQAMFEMRREKIGFVFQDFNLLGDLTVDENINIAMDLSECNVNDVSSYYKEFEIDQCKDKQCKYMSGGERQRTALVRAICKDSQIILADEPTGNLDNTNTKIVFDALKKISKERLVIVVTHDMEAATSYGDRLITLSDGSVLSDESYNDKNQNTSNTIEKAGTKAEHTKRRVNLKPIIKGHLKKNKRRNIMIVSICVILMLFTVATISLLNSMENVSTSINSIFGNDKVQISYQGYDGKSYSLSDEFIEEIKNTDSKEIVAYYGIPIGTYDEEEDYVSVSYELFNIDDFFKERFGYYGVELPKEENEIIVNTGFSKKVFGSDDCSGKTVWLYTASDTKIQCVVKSVSDTLIEGDEPKVFINTSILNKLGEEKIDSEDMMLYSQSKLNYSYINLKHTSQEKDVVYGKKLGGDNEALVNAGGINSLISVLELPYSFVSVEDVVNGKMSKELVDVILNSSVPIEKNINTEPCVTLKIVGITSDTDDSLDFYISDNTYNEAKKNKVTDMVIYLRNVGENQEQVIDITARYGYDYGNSGSAKAEVAVSKMRVTTVIMAVLAVVAIIMAFLFIRFATKINIINQTNEIGVLKALGANNNQIGALYIKENMLLFLISAGISGVVLIVLQVLKSLGYLVIDGIVIYNVNILHIIIIALIGIATVYMATFFEITKINKINLIELLRKSN